MILLPTNYLVTRSHSTNGYKSISAGSNVEWSLSTPKPQGAMGSMGMGDPMGGMGGMGMGGDKKGM
jgi:hypothetical protein